MTREHRLILMRHAKSDWYSGAFDDFSRPLSERGIRDARLMGRWLCEQDYLPETLLCSPARRTRETLQLVAAGAGVDLAAITTWCEPLYHSSAAVICDALSTHGRAGGVMVLGHNPGMEELLEWLLPKSANSRGFNKAFPTGAIYVLDCTGRVDDLTSGCARVVAHQRPKLLSG